MVILMKNHAETKERSAFLQISTIHAVAMVEAKYHAYAIRGNGDAEITSVQTIALEHMKRQRKNRNAIQTLGHRDIAIMMQKEICVHAIMEL